MRQAMHAWFFRDPNELHQFYFTDRNVFVTADRNLYRPIMILTALWVKDLPADDLGRLETAFCRDSPTRSRVRRL